MLNKPFWDFDEKKNYINVNIQEKNYKVINKFPDYYNAAILLYYIEKIIELISINLKENINNYSINDRIFIKCFCDIHPYKYKLSEMQLDTLFIGINKPRKLYKSNKECIGDDCQLRASYRHIFITLRYKNGKFKKIDNIMNLVIHELAHSMCNHVTWKDDNHGKDFRRSEKIIKDVFNNILLNNFKIN